MQVFNGHEWKVGKGQTIIPAEGRSFLQISVSCTQDVQLLGVRGEEEIPLKIGREFRCRSRADGFDKVILKGKPNCAYGYAIAHVSLQDGEPLNSDNPPAPPMPTHSNLVLDMRRLLQEEHNRNRPPVLEPENLPWAERYMVDDDDLRFEEELLAEHKATALSQQEPEPSTEPTSEPAPEPAPEPVPEAPLKAAE